MNRPSHDEPWLLDSVTTPSGGISRRCQRVKRDGAQCANPARSGFDVCWKHGAGSAKREAAAQRQPTGRPPTHGRAMTKGRYRTLREIMKDMEANGIDLDNCDEELRGAHAAFQKLLSYEEEMAPTLADLPESIRAFEASLAKRTVNAGEMPDLERFIDDAHRLHGMAIGMVERVQKAASTVTSLIKQRAETASRRSQAEQLKTLSTLTVLIRNIMWDFLPDEQLDEFEDRMRREIFAPHGVVVPELDRSLD